jgi:hypothetical protein
MVAILALLVGCAPTPASIEFSATEVAISSKDGAAEPTSTVKAADGAAIEGVAAKCTAPEGVTLADGKVTVAKSGTYTVDCAVEGTEVKGTYTVKASIPGAFTAALESVAVGATADVAVAWKDDAGADLAAAPAGAAVAVSLVDATKSTIATVDGTKVTGVAEGEVELLAKAEGFPEVKFMVKVVKADAAAAAPAAQ